MRVEIVTIGTELLEGRLDENAAFLARTFTDLGAEVGGITTVGDAVKEVTAGLRAAAARGDAVVATGGLGVTPDDVTRQALARLAGSPLATNRRTLASLQARYRREEKTMPALVRSQASLPAGARLLPNPVGQAPGLLLPLRGRPIFALPGVPVEMRAIVRGSVIPELRRRGAFAVRASETLCLFGISESEVAERIEPLVAASLACAVSYLPVGGHLRLVVSARGLGHGEARRAVSALGGRIERALGEHVYARGPEPVELEAAVGELLAANGRTLAVAESVTGGRVGALLTAVPGSSRYLDRVVVTYSDRSKVAELGVARHDLRAHGAVSPEVAEAMARGVRRAARTHYGISTTGIAGPGGATATKPVGLVYVSVATARRARTVRLVLGGTRVRVQQRAALTALNELRREILAEKARKRRRHA